MVSAEVERYDWETGLARMFRTHKGDNDEEVRVRASISLRYCAQPGAFPRGLDRKSVV